MVRVPDICSGDPGSIPGCGDFFRNMIDWICVENNTFEEYSIGNCSVMVRMLGSGSGGPRFDPWSCHFWFFSDFFASRRYYELSRSVIFSFFQLFVYGFDQNSGRCTFLLKSVARGRGRSRASRSPPHPLWLTWENKLLFISNFQGMFKPSKIKHFWTFIV